MKYYKVCKAVLTYSVGTNLEKVKNYANSRGLQVKEITKKEYMWACISFRSEAVFVLIIPRGIGGNPGKGCKIPN